MACLACQCFTFNAGPIMAAMSKEAQARIKINRLLEAAGWRFFDDGQGIANIALEPNIKLTQAQVDAMGNDFDATSQGFIDFLLLDVQGFPLVVLEAKVENKNPLIGKEQARKYARSQNCESTSNHRATMSSTATRRTKNANVTA